MNTDAIETIQGFFLHALQNCGVIHNIAVLLFLGLFANEGPRHRTASTKLSLRQDRGPLGL